MKIKVLKKIYLILSISIILIALIFFINDYHNYTKELDVYKNFIMDNHPKCTEEFWDANKKVFDEIYLKSYFDKDIAKTISMLLARIDDGHTSLNDLEKKYKSVDFKISCYNNKIYISKPSKTYPLLEKGDEIIQIGSMKTAEIIKNMTKYISADNIYFLNYRIQQLLFTDVYFDYLNLGKNTKITIKKNNNEIEAVDINLNIDYCPLNDYIFKNSYKIKKDYAVLNINNMIYNSNNLKILSCFFYNVNLNKINTIIVDISSCSGGNSYIINEFLKYIPIKEYYNYDGYKTFNNQYINKLYKGKIIILTSNKSYSAASGFAGVFKYNNLGILIGETLGGNANSYGNPKSMNINNTDYSLSVSTDLFQIPNKNNENLITPHIMLSDVINDYKGMNMYNDDMDKLYDIVLETCNNYTPNN